MFVCVFVCVCVCVCVCMHVRSFTYWDYAILEMFIASSLHCDDCQYCIEATCMIHKIILKTFLLLKFNIVNFTNSVLP